MENYNHVVKEENFEITIKVEADILLNNCANDTNKAVEIQKDVNYEEKVECKHEINEVRVELEKEKLAINETREEEDERKKMAGKKRSPEKVVVKTETQDNDPFSSGVVRNTIVKVENYEEYVGDELIRREETETDYIKIETSPAMFPREESGAKINDHLGDHQDIDEDNRLDPCVIDEERVERKSRVECRLLKCVICSKTYETYRNVHLHIEIEHEMPDLKLRENLIECEHDNKNHCRGCGLVFTNGAILLKHISEHLETGPFGTPTYFSCRICKHICTSHRGIHSHLSTKHCITDSEERVKFMVGRIDEKPRETDETSVDDQKRTIESSFRSCKYCQKYFVSEKSLQTHLLSSHAERVKPCDLVTRYQCTQCATSYSSGPNLKKHKKLKHAYKRGMFMCCVCFEKFDLMDQVDVHSKRVHTSDQPLMIMNKVEPPPSKRAKKSLAVADSDKVYINTPFVNKILGTDCNSDSDSDSDKVYINTPFVNKILGTDRNYSRHRVLPNILGKRSKQ